jgi:integrase
MSAKKVNGSAVKTQHPADFIEWDKFTGLIQSLEKTGKWKFALLLACGGFTGLRISDVLRLKYEDFKGSNSLYINEKKTGKPREITFNPELLKIIERNAKAEKGLIFLNTRGKTGKSISVQYINNTLKKIAKDYKIPGHISSHTLRKTFGRHVFENNGRSDEALIVLSDIFKHSSVRMTRIYLGINREAISNVYLSL